MGKKFLLEKLISMNTDTAVYILSIVENHIWSVTKMQPEYARMFAAEVKEEMKNQGLNNRTLGEKCGVTSVYISRVITGSASIGLNVANKLAKGLGMKIILCLGDVDE